MAWYKSALERFETILILILPSIWPIEIITININFLVFKFQIISIVP